STYKWTTLQEVIIRVYIPAVHEKHSVMAMLVVLGQKGMMDYGIKGKLTTDDEDARNVVRAYNDLVHKLSTEGISPIVPIDVSNIIFQYVCCLFDGNISDCIPEAIKNGLERLWLEFDGEKDKLMRDDQRSCIRGYASDAFRRIEESWQYLTPQDRRVFSAMLREVDIIGIIGRVVMLISREGAGNPVEWDYLREGLLMLRERLATLFAPAKASNHLGLANWIKVFDQFILLEEE
ncbi:hypothetical protein FRC07_013247, partial [Ceratobasidium sp. 392]